MFRAIFLALMLVPSFAFALLPPVPPDGVADYSRDERYIYEKIPVQLKFDNEQVAALSEARERIFAQLAALRAVNPRVGGRDKLISNEALDSAVFEKGLDDLVAFSQKNYGTIKDAGLHLYHVEPTGAIVYFGISISAGAGITAGTDILLGIVLVPREVKRIHIDNNQVDTYVEFDTSLVVWPNLKLGAGAGVAGTGIGGVGVIWGTLAKAEDFRGTVFGLEISMQAVLGTDIRLQALKNWAKKGAISNVFIAVGWTTGPGLQFSVRGNGSQVIDAQTFLRAGGGIIRGTFDRLQGISEPKQIQDHPPEILER